MDVINLRSDTQTWPTEAMLALKSAGVPASGRPPSHIRMVTHRHIDREAVDEAASRIRRALAAATGRVA
jgi:hypothetical protein